MLIIECGFENELRDNALAITENRRTARLVITWFDPFVYICMVLFSVIMKVTCNK